jgi:hypothetical protein
MNTYKGFKIGDRVSVKISEEAYDRTGLITPDMKGTLKSFAPKVKIIPVSITTDGLPYFAYVVFDKIYDPIHNNHVRGGVDIKNLKKEI